MVEELLAEIPGLIDQLADLETVLSVETQVIQEGDFATLEKVQREKNRLIPVLQRANSVLRAIAQSEYGINIDEDDDLYDLAVMMINVNRAAVENENAIVAAIRATQFTIRTMVKALRSENSDAFQRYTRSGHTIGIPGAAGLASREM
jgi:flagellar biosynthesis/type III secretory pathway chaperone